MGKNYQLSEDQKKHFAGLYLLEYMINTPKAIGIFLDGNNQDLETVLEYLMMKKLIDIRNKDQYIPTNTGREELKKFMSRYSEYLTMFDIYCAVDLESGDFAFSEYFNIENENEWQKYLNDKRWDDLRIAVAEFKNMDPVEIVFMSFINEKRFGRNESGWQFDLLLGSVWDNILEICNSAIQWDQLGFEDDQGKVPAEDVIGDIIGQGTDIMLDLLDQEITLEGEESFRDYDDDADEEYYVDQVEFPRFSRSHYKSYRDPYYVSPNWRN